MDKEYEKIMQILMDPQTSPKERERAAKRMQEVAERMQRELMSQMGGVLPPEEEEPPSKPKKGRQQDAPEADLDALGKEMMRKMEAAVQDMSKMFSGAGMPDISEMMAGMGAAGAAAGMPGMSKRSGGGDAPPAGPIDDEERVRRAIALDKNNADLHFELAMILFGKGDEAGGQKEMDESARIRNGQV
ncbi:MAG: hypothetical protein LBH69_00890 [Methanomassiliicoccaceae archaeon]|jgi:hypothetical protein|nr:hypothetical protein [Methanomassiliicoccaceae archaeon]